MAMESVQSRTYRDMLRDPPLRTFWLANTFSGLGTGAFIMALNWLTVRQHGAPGIAALVIGYGVPQFALQLLGGSVSDRLDRRRLFAITQIGFLVVAMGLLMAASHNVAHLWVLVAVNVLFGGISAFDTPARTALISQMVESHEVVAVQQLFNLSGGITNVLGPALGGILLTVGNADQTREELAFLFNVVSYIPLLLSLPFLRVTLADEATQHSHRILDGVREGLLYVRGQASLQSLLILLAVVMLLGMPFQTLLPIFVHRHLSLETGHGFYAALLSAAGLGALWGSLLGLSGSQSRSKGHLLVWASLGLGTSIFLLVGSSLIHWASLAVFLAGACGAFTINLDTAIIQGITPSAMQGRVAAIANLTKGLQAFSAAAASLAMHRLGYFGVQLSLAGMLVVGALFLYPSLRRARI